MHVLNKNKELYEMRCAVALTVANDHVTRHNSADSVPTSNFDCIKKVAIRTTFSHMINIAGIIYYTLLTFKLPVIKMPLTNVFNEFCVKIDLLRSTSNKF